MTESKSLNEIHPSQKEIQFNTAIFPKDFVIGEEQDAQLTLNFDSGYDRCGIYLQPQEAMLLGMWLIAAGSRVSQRCEESIGTVEMKL